MLFKEECFLSFSSFLCLLFFEQCCLFSLQFFQSFSVLNLNEFSLVFKLNNSILVIVIIPFFVSFSLHLHLGHIRLSSIFGFIDMSYTRDRSNSNVLANEILSCEICKDITVLNAFFVFLLGSFLGQFFKFIYNNYVHSFKDSSNVRSSLLEDLVIHQVTKLIIDSSSPS